MNVLSQMSNVRLFAFLRTFDKMEKSDIVIKVCIVNFLSDEEFLNIRLVSRDWDKICHLAGIQKILRLSRMRINKEQAQKLVKLPFSNLCFDHCTVEHQALFVISQSGKHRSLEFSHSKIRDAGLRLLSRGNLPALQSLSINHDMIRYDGVMGLVWGGNLTTLTSLSLSYVTIGDASVRGLISGKNLNSLTSLNLSGNQMLEQQL
jgi:hypothetical protein